MGVRRRGAVVAAESSQVPITLDFPLCKAVAFFRLVKTPENPRSYLPRLTDPQAADEREERVLPRYVELRALREHGFGPRNLFWGVFTLVLALILLVVALFFAGPKAFLSLATTLLTFTVLFVLSRLHIFRQRNGAFLALALVCLLGASIPLVERALSVLETLARQQASTAASPVTAPGQVDAGPPLLTQSFALAKPEGPALNVKVLKDSRVVIGERPFLINAGDLFSLIEAKTDEVTFAVRDLQVSLPANVVEIMDPKAVARGVAAAASPQPPQVAPGATKPSAAALPSPPDLAEITIGAQQEAIRRYPALGTKDSLENAAFVSTYKQLKDAGGADFFANPEWPIELAELLAKREGWNRGGRPLTTGPAPVLDPPATERPVEDLNDGVGAGFQRSNRPNR